MSWILKEIVELILELPGDFASLAPGSTWILIISLALFAVFCLVCMNCRPNASTQYSILT